MYIQNVGVLASLKTNSIPVVKGRLSRSDSPCVLDSDVNATSRSKTKSPMVMVGVIPSGSNAMKGSGVGLEAGVGVGVNRGVEVGFGV